MATHRPPARSPRRVSQRGLRSVPTTHEIPRQRACDDPTLVLRSIIYAWRIYEIDPSTGLLLPPDPQTGQRPWRYDYIGQTIRTLDKRSREHLEDKPWADIVVDAMPVILLEGEWTKAQRDAAEVAAIKRHRPRYNHDENLDNPLRVEIWRQVEQRHARDDAAGRPRWIPADQRTAIAQREAELAVVQGGMDGREPLYPGTVIWRAATALVRLVARAPRPLQLAVLAAGLGAWMAWSVASLLIGYAHFPERVGRPLAVLLTAAALAGVLRAEPVRQWSKRKRRR